MPKHKTNFDLMWLRDSCKSWRGDGWAWAWVASVIGSVYLKVLKLIQTLFTFYLKVTQAGIENANLLLLPFPLEHNWVYKFRYCHFLPSFGSHVWESCTGMYRYIYLSFYKSNYSKRHVSNLYVLKTYSQNNFPTRGHWKSCCFSETNNYG